MTACVRKKFELISPKTCREQSRRICREGGISPPPSLLPPTETPLIDRKTAKEPEEISVVSLSNPSAQTSFRVKSRLPSFLYLIEFIKFVSIFMKG